MTASTTVNEPARASAATSADRIRQVGVVIAEIACVFGTLVGVGVLGTRVEEASGGRLAADATLIAPAGPAFSIWSVIYLGLAAYTLWHVLPRNAAHPRARATGWLAAASMILNAGWLLVTQAGWLWASVGVIVALAVVLGVLVRQLTALPTTSRVEAVLIDGTFGLYLGWVSVATAANITATLIDSGVQPGPEIAQALAVVVLAVAAAIGVVLARRLGARYAVTAAMVWGLGWIAIGRLTDAPNSTVTGIAAILAALVIVAETVRRRRLS